MAEKRRGGKEAVRVIGRGSGEAMKRQWRQQRGHGEADERQRMGGKSKEVAER